MPTGSSSSPVPVRRSAVRRPILFGCALLALVSSPALAADFPEPRLYDGPPEEAYPERRPPPLRLDERERFERRGPCRTTLRRHITREGEEIERRVTVCDEGPVRDRFEPGPRPEFRDGGRPLPPRGVPDDGVEGRGPGSGPDADGPFEDGPAPDERGGGPRY